MSLAKRTNQFFFSLTSHKTDTRVKYTDKNDDNFWMIFSAPAAVGRISYIYGMRSKENDNMP